MMNAECKVTGTRYAVTEPLSLIIPHSVFIIAFQCTQGKGPPPFSSMVRPSV